MDPQPGCFDPILLSSRSSALLWLLFAWLPATQAAPNDGIVGSYVRAEFGSSSFGLPEASTTWASDDRGRAGKLFYGYRFDERWGVELGYGKLGSFRLGVSRNGIAGSSPARGRASNGFAVATGRLPLGNTWATLVRGGLSSGRVRGDGVAGSKTSPTLGIGVEYRPRPSLVMTLNYDNYGELADELKARSLVFGLHFTL